MTLNPDVVRTRCADIEEACVRLARFAAMPADAFLADSDAVDAASYRLLVHMYARVDPARLHGVLRDNLDDLRSFSRTVAGLL